MYAFIHVGMCVCMCVCVCVCVCLCLCACMRAGLTLVFVLGARLELLHVEGALRLHPLLGVQEAFLHETQSVQRLVSGGRRLLR